MPDEEIIKLIISILLLILLLLGVYLNSHEKSKKIDKTIKKIYVKDRELQNQYEESSNYRINKRTHRYTGNEPMTYELKQSVLSNKEKVMYGILEGYCKKNNLVLLAKIRMADFIDTIDIGDRDIYDEALSNVWAKHVDFLICDPNDFRPKAAIEVDDSSHDSEDRQERDKFVDKVYNRVNLQIFHFRELDEEYIYFKLNRFFGIETDVH